MQTPLSVYLLIDKKNRQATEIFNKFYTLLCRDVEKPLHIPEHTRSLSGSL